MGPDAIAERHSEAVVWIMRGVIAYSIGMAIYGWYVLTYIANK